MFNNLCTVCLSRDRQLYKLGTLRSLYDLIVPDVDESFGVQLCWECRSVLQKCSQFQKNVAAAGELLLTLKSKLNTFSENEVQTFSRLVSTVKSDVDFYYFCKLNEADIPVKAEILVKEVSFSPEKITEPLIDVKFEGSLEDDQYSLSPPSSVGDDPLCEIPDKDSLKEIPEFEEPKTMTIDKVELIKLSKENVPEQIIQEHPGTSTNNKKRIFKIPAGMAGKIKMLMSQNKPVKIKLGDEVINKVFVLKSDKNIVKNKGVSKKKVNKIRVSKQMPPESTVKRRPLTDEVTVPSRKQIFQHFNTMLRNTICEDSRKNVKVTVMTDEEAAAHREAMRAEQQFANSQYKCHSCIIGYYSQQQLDDHNSAKHVQRPLTVRCSTCLSYIPESMFAFHTGRHLVLYQCLLCEYAAREPRRLREHLRLHSAPPTSHAKPYTCRICHLEFLSKHRLRVHKDEKHAPQQQYTCDLCGKTFEARWSFKDHIKRHSIPNEPVECTICNKKYKNAVSFSTHCRNVHKRAPGEKFRCEECDMTFVNQQSLNMHLKYSRTHVQPEHFKHICYACGKGFMFERQMKDHINFVHNGHTDYVCSYCNKMYSSAGGLRKHVKFVHEGGTYQKDKVCNICGKSFTSPKTLREHHNIHSGSRPFACGACGARFRQSAALYTHRRLVHLGYKMRNKKVVKCGG